MTLQCKQVHSLIELLKLECEEVVFLQTSTKSLSSVGFSLLKLPFLGSILVIFWILFLLSNIYKCLFPFSFQCGNRKNGSINYHGDGNVSNRGQPAGLPSVNSTANERSASHADTDRSKCKPRMIRLGPGYLFG